MNRHHTSHTLNAMFCLTTTASHFAMTCIMIADSATFCPITEREAAADVAKHELHLDKVYLDNMYPAQEYDRVQGPCGCTYCQAEQAHFDRMDQENYEQFLQESADEERWFGADQPDEDRFADYNFEPNETIEDYMEMYADLYAEQFRAEFEALCWNCWECNDYQVIVPNSGNRCAECVAAAIIEAEHYKTHCPDCEKPNPICSCDCDDRAQELLEQQWHDQDMAELAEARRSNPEYARIKTMLQAFDQEITAEDDEFRLAFIARFKANNPGA